MPGSATKTRRLPRARTMPPGTGVTRSTTVVSAGTSGTSTRPRTRTAGRFVATGLPSSTTRIASAGNTAIERDIQHAMRRLFSAFRAAAIGFARDGCAFAAQAVAFNAIFSLFPLSVLGVAAISLVFHEGTRRLHLLAAAAPTLYRFVASNMHAYAYGRGVSS